MRDFKKCEICGKYDFTATHKCAPIYYFIHEDWGDEPQEIRAHSFEQAARSFAEAYNEDDGDFSLMDGRTVEVIISKDNISKTFIVSAEPSVDYWVKEKEIKDGN